MNVVNFNITGARVSPDFSQVAAAALNSVDAVLGHWLPSGKRQGNEYLHTNPRRSDKKAGSFSINTNTGQWADFATGDKGGDLVSLVAYLEGVRQGEANQKLAEFLGISSKTGGTSGTGGTTTKKLEKSNRLGDSKLSHLNDSVGGTGGTKQEWTPILPIPDDAPPHPVKLGKLGKAVAGWSYLDAEGKRLFFVIRFETENGKEMRPLSYCQGTNGKREWRWKGLPEPRPLYNLDQLAANPDAVVIFTEGEKAAEAAPTLFPGCVSTTIPNGAQSPGKTDFSPLAGRTVWVWPDNDDPGRQFADTVARMAMEAGAAEVLELRINDGLDRKPSIDENGKAVLIPRYASDPLLPDGWDAADAVADGWTAEHVDQLLTDPAFLMEPRAVRKAAMDEMQASGLASNGGESPEHGEDIKIPAEDRFTVNDSGVWYQPPPIKGKQPPFVWVCARLDISAETRDDDSDNHGLLLEFKDRHGHPHRWAMPGEMLEDKREYRKVLRRLGLPLSGSRDAYDALQMYFDVCRSPNRAICVGKIGWYGSAYVLPDKVLNDTGEERVFLQTLDANIEGYRQAGTLEEWKSHVAGLCVGNSRLLFAVAMAFAAPLLKWTNDESGGIHYKNASSSGKTSVCYPAKSVWGEQAGIESWRTTANGLEGVSERHNDNLLVLDELKLVDPKEAGGVAYMLGNGNGKRRGLKHGGTQKRLTWRLLFLSTGEISLEQHMLKGGEKIHAGQEVRLVDVPADAGKGYGLFEDLHGHLDGAAFAKAIKAATGQYHGTAGRAFIDVFCRDIPGALEAIKQLREAFTSAYVPNDASGQVHRVAQRIALIGAAGELATRYGITGWPEGAAMDAAWVCLEAWISGRGGVGNSEIDQALSQVRAFFESHGESRFTPWHDKGGQCDRCGGTGDVTFTSYKRGICFDCNGTGNVDGTDENRRLPVRDRAGFRRATSDGRTEYYAFPEVFKRDVCVGIDVSFTTKLLVDRGLLMPDNDGKGTRKERLPSIGLQRVYRFTADILGGRDDDNA